MVESNKDEDSSDDFDLDYDMFAAASQSHSMDLPHRPTFMKEKKETKTDLLSLTGFLYKFSPAMFKSWQRRKVVLKDRQLKYYKEKSSGVWD